MAARRTTAFTEDAHARAARLLEGFVGTGGIHWALLLDDSGNQLVSAGEPPRCDIPMFASLAAADFAAGAQLAKIVGAGELQTFYHEGERESIFFAAVVAAAVVVVLFDSSSIPLGAVTLHTKRLAKDLFPIMAGAANPSALRRPNSPLQAHYADEAATEIDRVFRDR